MLIRQTLPGATQFTGSPGAGRFSFADFDGLPETQRLQIVRVSYHAPPPGVGATDLAIYLEPRGGSVNERILIARGTTTEITAPDGSVDLAACGGLVTREPGPLGAFWDLTVYTSGKTTSGTVVIDYIAQEALGAAQ